MQPLRAYVHAFATLTKVLKNTNYYKEMQLLRALKPVKCFLYKRQR